MAGKPKFKLPKGAKPGRITAGLAKPYPKAEKVRGVPKHVASSKTTRGKNKLKKYVTKKLSADISRQVKHIQKHSALRINEGFATEGMFKKRGLPETYRPGVDDPPKTDRMKNVVVEKKPKRPRREENMAKKKTPSKAPTTQSPGAARWNNANIKIGKQQAKVKKDLANLAKNNPKGKDSLQYKNALKAAKKWGYKPDYKVPGLGSYKEGTAAPKAPAAPRIGSRRKGQGAKATAARAKPPVDMRYADPDYAKNKAARLFHAAAKKLKAEKGAFPKNESPHQNKPGGTKRPGIRDTTKAQDAAKAKPAAVGADGGKPRRHAAAKRRAKATATRARAATRVPYNQLPFNPQGVHDLTPSSAAGKVKTKLLGRPSVPPKAKSVPGKVGKVTLKATGKPITNFERNPHRGHVMGGQIPKNRSLVKASTGSKIRATLGRTFALAKRGGGAAMAVAAAYGAAEGALHIITHGLSKATKDMKPLKVSQKTIDRGKQMAAKDKGNDPMTDVMGGTTSPRKKAGKVPVSPYKPSMLTDVYAASVPPTNPTGTIKGNKAPSTKFVPDMPSSYPKVKSGPSPGPSKVKYAQMLSYASAGKKFKSPVVTKVAPAVAAHQKPNNVDKPKRTSSMKPVAAAKVVKKPTMSFKELERDPMFSKKKSAAPIATRSANGKKSQVTAFGQAFRKARRAGLKQFPFDGVYKGKRRKGIFTTRLAK